MTEINSVCIYCGSHPGNDPEFMETAWQFGKILAEQQITLVYGGGTNGIMGAAARGAKENGGTVIGIIPEFLLAHEAKHDPKSLCDEVIVTSNMHERKQNMFEKSDAFVTLPGGIGTLEEIVEMMTWAQLGRHRKPMCFLNIGNFWKPLFELMDHMREAGFIHSERNLDIQIADHPADILPKLSHDV